MSVDLDFLQRNAKASTTSGTFHMKKETRARLRELSEEHNVSMSSIVEGALEQVFASIDANATEK